MNSAEHESKQIEENTSEPQTDEMIPIETEQEEPEPTAKVDGGLTIEDAQQIINQLREGNRNYHDQNLRLRADFENSKRRLEREKENQVQQEKSRILLEILSVVDNFDRALTAVTDPNDPLAMGLIMVHKQIMDFLRSQGMEHIESQDQPFDPYLHEALAQQETDEVPDHTIIEVFRKGYKLDGKLLRAAQVKVAITPTEKAGPEPESED